MAEPHVVGALRKKRAEIFGQIISLEKEVQQRRVDLKHVDATLRLFVPGYLKRSGRPVWLRRGECSRLVLDVLRDADAPLTTQEILEQLLKTKRASGVDAKAREALHKTLLAALNSGKSKGLVERTDTGRGAAARWRLKP